MEVAVEQCIRSVVGMNQAFEVQIFDNDLPQPLLHREKDAEMLLVIFGAVAKVLRSEPNEILIKYRLRAAR